MYLYNLCKFSILKLYVSTDNGLAMERPRKNKKFNSTGSVIFLLYFCTSSSSHQDINTTTYQQSFYILQP